MKTWVKLYTEIINDPKMIRMTWAQRGIWDALLALAGQVDEQDENGPTGCVGSAQDAALMIRCNDNEFAEAVSAFAERGMIEEHDGILYLSRFAERQSRAPSSQREAVTERVKRHRMCKANACNEDVTRVKRGVTPSDTETDTETDTERDTETDTERERERELSASSSPFADELREYSNTIGMVSGGLQSEEIVAMLEELRERGVPDWWGLAIKVCADQNKRRWSYLRAVLGNWLKQGHPEDHGSTPGARASPKIRVIKVRDEATGALVEKEVRG